MSANTLGMTARLGLVNFTFILPFNSRCTTREFARMIRAGYDSPQAREIAQSFDNIDGMISRDWSGVKYAPMSPDNMIEIHVRNAGWVADKSSPYPTMPYKLARLPHADKGGPQALTGNYPSPSMAYAAAAKQLGMHVPGATPVTDHPVADRDEADRDGNDPAPAPAP